MPIPGLPTGTVGDRGDDGVKGTEPPPAPSPSPGSPSTDDAGRVAELAAENRALRRELARREAKHREVEARYERLLIAAHERATEEPSPPTGDSWQLRLARVLGLR